MERQDERWNILMEHNRLLDTRLLVWEMLICQLAHRDQVLDERYARIMQFVREVLEQDLIRRSAIKEVQLYAQLEREAPQLRRLLGELYKEHEALFGKLEAIHRELSHATPESAGVIRELGLGFTQALRAHMRREEQELIPAAAETLEYRAAS
ncbi:MAG TPA: hemerythrin domain-containing protein [Terriglobales bacterium]|nr:hemerythrin domain-containing protein [Terriglobales bacterium]